MISYSLVGESLIVDPEDWDSAKMEAISGVGSLLASSRFAATITSFNGVARTLAIVAELFVGLLTMIARAKGIT